MENAMESLDIHQILSNFRIVQSRYFENAWNFVKVTILLIGKNVKMILIAVISIVVTMASALIAQRINTATKTRSATTMNAEKIHAPAGASTMGIARRVNATTDIIVEKRTMTGAAA
jgi:hypothetical protein